MRFGNFVVVKYNGRVVCGKLGDCGIYLEYMGDANPIPPSKVEPLFEIEVSRPFPEHITVDDFRKFVISTLTDADPAKGPHPAITNCEGCGCDCLDNGPSPGSCPCCKQSSEIEALRAEVERLRTDGASAVRWAPSSAYWSSVLRELFGLDARVGIDALEARWRAELERADTAEALLRQVLEILGRAHQTAMEQTLKARLPECGEFAGIAQDLDFVVSTLRERLSKEER